MYLSLSPLLCFFAQYCLSHIPFPCTYFLLYRSFFSTLCFWSPNAHQPSSHCWFNTFFLHSPLLQHRTECIAPLLALLCSGILVSWSPGLVCLQPCLNCRDLDTSRRQKNIIIIDLGLHHHCLGKGAENQNGNLRWHLPWRRGGLEGVSFAIKLFWKMIFLKTI